MLSEEALILLVVVGACTLLVLGVLELLWPTRPRHPVRRSSAGGLRRGARDVKSSRAAAAGHGYVRRAARVPSAPVAARPVAAAPAAPPPVAPPPAEVPAPSGALDAPAVVPALPAPAPAVTPPTETPARVDRSPVEQCFALYQEQRFVEVVSTGTAALAAPAASRAQETAALWSVIGLARQALGEHEGARAAFETAIDAAPGDDRKTYQRHLATLALGAAQSLIARAQGHAAAEAEERVTSLRAAIAWLDRGIAAVPGDASLREALREAQTMLWPTYEQAVMGLLHRQEFHAARWLLREALADESLPATRGETFRELLMGTFSGEIGQLTAQAIRSMQEARESEALASLRRAEELLATLPEEALPPKRREEVDRRLWWGYTKLGVRCVEAAEYEAALDPLFHALGFAAVGADRQGEARAALVRALEGVVDGRAPAIRQLADAGDREEAATRADKLWELLRSCMECGVSQDDLSAALAKTRRLFEQLGRAEPE